MSAFMKTFTDCLVLKLEEIEAETDQIDTSLYIIYDKRNNRYLIRGRRRWKPTCQSCTYSFECEYADNLVDFIDYLICSDNKVNEILYNYDNFPENSDDISFEFLQEYEHSDYEISGYNRQKLKKRRLFKTLKMLENVFNYY